MADAGIALLSRHLMMSRWGINGMFYIYYIYYKSMNAVLITMHSGIASSMSDTCNFTFTGCIRQTLLFRATYIAMHFFQFMHFLVKPCKPHAQLFELHLY